MLGLKGELEVDNVGAFQLHHDVALVADHTLLSTLKQPLLLHQLQRVEYPSGFETSQEHPGEATSADALDDVEVRQLDGVSLLFLPDRLNLQQLVTEDTDGFASLEVVVLQHIPST